MTVPHVPAWRRLGLKLKYTPEVTRSPTTGPEQNDKKRKATSSTEIDHESASVPREVKKAKKSKTSSAKVGATPAYELTLKLPSKEAEKTPDPADALLPNSTKRKSVTFTADTKTKDGDSIKQIYQTWLAQQTDDFDSAKVSEALRSVTPKAISEPGTDLSGTKAKKPKALKNTPKSSTVSKIQCSTAPLTSTLDYLNSYHNSRQTWKFNKSKQNQLLKHAFEIAKIPPEYDTALKTYIMGLESTAARARLREKAHEIRNEDTDSPSPSSETSSAASPNDSDSSSEDNVTTQTTSEARSDTAKQSASTDMTAEVEDNTAPEPDLQSGPEPESEKRRREDYRQAIQHYKEQLKSGIIDQEERELRLSREWRRKLHKRKRAEMVLWCVGEEGPSPVQANSESSKRASANRMNGAKGVHRAHRILASQENTFVQTETQDDNIAKRQKLNNDDVNGAPVPAKKKRKRKRRTGVPDDDSSSTESSSSSSEGSSDSSSEDGGDGGDAGKDNSSSSSSGSSSSSSKSSGSDESADDDEETGSGERSSSKESSSSGSDGSEDSGSGSGDSSGSESGSGSGSD